MFKLRYGQILAHNWLDYSALRSGCCGKIHVPSRIWAKVCLLASWEGEAFVHKL
jgi:hypothetical protein